jgi:probable phosphoglycerate mutase
MKIAAIYASPLERAQETAAAIARHHEGLQVQTAEGLGETRCGDWTGQAIEDLAKTDLWRQVQFAPSAFRFPNGDSMLETQTRLLACLEGLAASHPGETIIAVSHSDPIKLVTAFYLGMPLDLFQRLSISPASITEFAFTPFGAHLLRCNDTAHVPPEPEEQEEPEAVAAGAEPEKSAESAAQGA